MTKGERTKKVLALLDQYYGTDMKIYLHYDHEEPWQLLFATILSAQCTDARVNIVTKDLFVKYPTLEAFASADISEMENDIRSIGFYHGKARNLIACARRLLEVYGGELPRDIDELTTLPGVGRKTANVVRGNIFNDPSIVVDTHVKRVMKRLGLTDETDPAKVEQDLMKILPKDHWIRINLQGIRLGREICNARSPKCQECFLSGCCREYGENHAGSGQHSRAGL